MRWNHPLLLAAVAVAASLVTPSSLRAQSPDLPTTLTQAISKQLGTDRYSLLNLDLPAKPGAQCEVLFELDERPAALALNQHSVRSFAFRLLTRGPSGATVEVAAAAPSTYRGALHLLGGAPEGDGLVAASLEADGLTALLILEDGSIRVIEPAAGISKLAWPGLHLIYDAADVRSELGGCAATGPSLASLPDLRSPPDMSEGATLKLCQLALEADTYYYAWKGSTVPTTRAAVESLVNSIALIYETYAGITFELTTLVVQANSTNNDHYGSNKYDKLLNQYVNYWRSNYGGIKRDTAHLLTGRTMQNLIAGYAYIGVICNKNIAFGWSWANAPVSTAQRIAITAHELGHNFNAQHCNGDPDCAVMCATIGLCSGLVDRFGSRSLGKIISWRNNSSCLSNQPPTIELPFAELFHKLKSKIWASKKGVALSTKAVGETSGKKAVNLDKASDLLRTYKMDLSTAGDPVLSYFVQHRKVEAGEQLIIEYQNSSSTWIELARVTSNGITQNSFRYYEHALPGDALWNSCLIRFTTNCDQGNDDWYIDDVQVKSTTPSALAAVCSSDTPALLATVVVAGSAPAAQQIQVKNCGAEGSSLDWLASESPAVAWMDITPASGTVTPGEPFDAVTVDFDPTGLTAGVYTTMVKVQRSGAPAEYIEVPVTLVVHAGTLFQPGVQLQGEVNPVGDTDLAAFYGAEGQKLILRTSVNGGDLQPTVTLLDASGATLATLDFPRSTTPRKLKVRLPSSGLFGLLISGRNGTAGLYNIFTSIKQPDSAMLSVRNAKPAVAGGTVQLEVAATPGTMLSATVVPKTDGIGPLTLSLIDPNSRTIYTNLFNRALYTGGAQMLQIPLGLPGLYTLEISGFANREKVTATLDPLLPAGGGGPIVLP